MRPQNKPKRNTKRCFVVSPIGPEESKIRQRSDKVLRHIITPVCTELGITAFRADEMDHPSLISKAVMRELLMADVVIADLTGANPNVYYELAVRHFVGKPVVQFIEKGEKIPFDLSDVNIIEVDHTDLDSVHRAKERMKAFMESGMNVPDHDNPVSSALKELGVTVQGLSIKRQSLAEQFEEFSATILEELKNSRKERDLLWERFGETRSHQGSAPAKALNPILDLTGNWQSNFGKVRIVQNRDDVFGSYEYGNLGWVGELRGNVVDRTVVFRWQWPDALLNGVGYWKIEENKLRGRWFYDQEVSVTLKELKSKPTYLDKAHVILTSREERQWYLSRLSQ